MIAITFALPAESSTLVHRLTNRRSKSLGHAEIIRGEFNERAIVVFHTGVGRKVCEQRIHEFFAQEHPNLLISAGFAGGLNEDYSAGDLFLARNFSDPQLLSFAQRTLRDEQPHHGKLFTSTALIDSAQERAEIARAHGADAVDMETEFIAQACDDRGVPLLALRAISDTVREPFPVSASLLFDLERQKTNFGRLAAHLIARPANIGRMMRFFGQVRRARGHLAIALAKLLQSDSFAPSRTGSER
jgi:adenosylhomocysteine nucleosidase